MTTSNAERSGFTPAFFGGRFSSGPRASDMSIAEYIGGLAWLTALLAPLPYRILF